MMINGQTHHGSHRLEHMPSASVPRSISQRHGDPGSKTNGTDVTVKLKEVGLVNLVGG